MAEQKPTVEKKSGGIKSFVGFVSKRSFLITAGVVIAFVMLIAMKGCGDPKTVEQNLGTKPVGERETDPTSDAQYVASRIKERDAEIAEKALASKKNVQGGVAFMPELTNEYDDPLAGYAAASVGYIDRREGDPFAKVERAPVTPTTVPRPTQVPQGKAGAPRYETLTKVLIGQRDLSTNQTSTGVSRAPVAVPTPPPAPVMASSGDVEAAPKIASMGEVLYAVMDLEANSDYSKFVQATIIGGELSGTKLQGSFTRTDDRLEITFNRAAVKGVTHSLSGIAVNPYEPTVGLATEVNKHYLSRFGGLFLAAAIRGVGQELTREGTTVSTNINGQTTTTVPRRDAGDLALIGAGEVAAEVGGVLRQGLGRPPTVIVAAGTEIGVLLTSDWMPPVPNQVGAAPAGNQSVASANRETQTTSVE